MPHTPFELQKIPPDNFEDAVEKDKKLEAALNKKKNIIIIILTQNDNPIYNAIIQLDK